jgi:hypothetical protein
MATLNVTRGFWRHSTSTVQTWYCKSLNGWSPCRGGADAEGHGALGMGSGYYEAAEDGGDMGVRCEACVSENHHFDKLDASNFAAIPIPVLLLSGHLICVPFPLRTGCRDCGDITTQAVAIGCGLLVSCLTLAGCGAAMRKRQNKSRASRAILKRATGIYTLWIEAGMQFKMKALVGVVQCVAAVPSVFNLITPPGLEEYTSWIYLLEAPIDLTNLIIPAQCFGSYRRRLLIGSCWPIALLLLVAVSCTIWEFARHRWTRNPTALALRGSRAALRAGLQHSLPAVLMVTFVLVPSTSTMIFKTFRCESIEYAPGDLRRYLAADVHLSCDSKEYATTRGIALVMVAVWPIGTPLLYALLLYISRDALLTRKPTQLSRAIAFLSDDCISAEIRPARSSAHAND